MKVIKIMAYVNNTEMSRHALDRVTKEYPNKHIYDSDSLPKDAEVIDNVVVQCWGFPSYGFTFFVEA